MDSKASSGSRRAFLTRAAAGAGAIGAAFYWCARPVCRGSLPLTPRLTEGPFYLSSCRSIATAIW